MNRSRLLSSGFGLVAAAAFLACGEPSLLAVEEAPSAFSVSASDLVSCAVAESQSASAVIGPRGGRITVGANSILVPAGAVRRPTEITMTVPASEHLEVDLRAAGHEHFEFNRPVVVTVSYGHCPEIEVGGRADIWHVDPDTKALLEPMPTRINERARSVTFFTDHFSFFAMAN